MLDVTVLAPGEPIFSPGFPFLALLELIVQELPAYRQAQFAQGINFRR